MEDVTLLGCDERYQFASLWRTSAGIFALVVIKTEKYGTPSCEFTAAVIVQSFTGTFRSCIDFNATYGDCVTGLCMYDIVDIVSI